MSRGSVVGAEVIGDSAGTTRGGGSGGGGGGGGGVGGGGGAPAPVPPTHPIPTPAQTLAELLVDNPSFIHAAGAGTAGSPFLFSGSGIFIFPGVAERFV